MSEKEMPSYFTLIPAPVRYDENLKPSEKILYSEIAALLNEDGYCNATNNYFANLYKVDKATISRRISNLKNRGHIDLVINKDESTNQILSRSIFLTQTKKG